MLCISDEHSHQQARRVLQHQGKDKMSRRRGRCSGRGSGGRRPCPCRRRAGCGVTSAPRSGQEHRHQPEDQSHDHRNTHAEQRHSHLQLDPGLTRNQPFEDRGRRCARDPEPPGQRTDRRAAERERRFDDELPHQRCGFTPTAARTAVFLVTAGKTQLRNMSARRCVSAMRQQHRDDDRAHRKERTSERGRRCCR